MAETFRLRIDSILQIAQKNGEKLMFVSCKYPFSTSLEEFYFHELLSIQVFMCNEGICVFSFFSWGKEGFGLCILDCVQTNGFMSDMFGGNNRGCFSWIVS